MGLFDQVVGALNNPQQQASSGQIGSILQLVNQISTQQGLDALTTQKLLSVVGQHVRSSLGRQQLENSQSQAESLVERFGGTQQNAEAVQSLFTRKEEEATVRDAAQKTGLNGQTVQNLLPVLVPIVLQFLKTGASKQPGQGNNSVLSAFLDSDRDGDVDVGDALSVASRFLQNR